MGRDGTNLSEKAYKIIKNEILQGNIKQNEVISINSICEELKISRTPVTNAFKKLELENLVTILPKQGVFIKPITLSETKEIYELRAAVETFSANNSFDLIGDEDVDWLKRSIESQKEALKDNDYTKFMEYDIEFHKYLLKIYDNKKFLEIIDNHYDRVLVLGLIGTCTGDRAIQTIKEHTEIVKSIENKDKNKFVHDVETNIVNGYINLIKNYKID